MSMISFCKLPHIIVQASGAHATRYLNSRLTNNINILNIGESCQAAALTPQGKTELLASVLKINKNEYLISCNCEADKALAALQRFKVADLVDFKVREDLNLFHFLAEAVIESSTLVALTNIENAKFSYASTNSRFGRAGCDVITDLTKPSLPTLNPKELSAEEIELLRISNKVPSFPQEINENFLFTEANQWQMISDNKGCYCGQEVVEKARSRGETPFVIVAFTTSNQNITAFTKMSPNENLQLEILSAIYDPKSLCTYGFLRIRRRDLQNDLVINGTSLTLAEC